MRRRVLPVIFCLAVAAFPQAAKKLRVLAAPGVSETNPKDWNNNLGSSGTALTLDCSSCKPVSKVSIPASSISSLKYGDNAYHHWAAGAVTAFATLGVGAIVGFMPHHQHFFSIDLKDGKVLAIQADKSNYKMIAGMLENTAGLPIEVSPKDAHFLSGLDVKVDTSETK